ncbi:MAG: DinB family protein [Candidatus Hodarchaeota archaeon]
MSDTNYDERSFKEYAIDVLEISYTNLLVSIQGIKPGEVLKQINSEIHPIGYIISHCAAHMNTTFVKKCQGKTVLPEKYKFSFKRLREIENFSFEELVNGFVQVAESSFTYLRDLPEEKFRDVPEKSTSKAQRQESVSRLIQRIALHFMGHMGQIRIIRTELGNPAGSFFVAGISKEGREDLLTKWKAWWNKNKEKFQ